MAKYESPCQVIGLFAGAILVSCGVIYILTLEANKRGYGEVTDRRFESPKISGVPIVRKKRSAHFETEDEVDEDHQKWMTWSGDKDPIDFMDWSVDSEGNFFMDIPLSDMNENHEVVDMDNQMEGQYERAISMEDRLDNYDDYDTENQNDTKYATDLSENLLMEGLNHRKIRNIEEKIEWLKKDDQIVAEIVRQFCPKPSTTTISPTTEAPELNDFNVIDTENDVGWHDADNVFVFDEDFYEDDDASAKVQLNNNQMNHENDVPPLLVERDANIADVHVPWKSHNGEYSQDKAPDRHSGIKCESESEILLTVAITTVVNFLFFGFIMIAKNWICDSYQFGKEFAEDSTPFVNNDEFDGDADVMTCNCMDENCPNSRAAPYDRISVPYKRFRNEPDMSGSMDVVGTAINSRASTPAASFYPPGLSVNSGDIVMASTYPPHRQFASNPYEVERINNLTRFYNRNLMLQDNLPMQHHQNNSMSNPRSSMDSNKMMEERLMISSVDSTPHMEDDSKVQSTVNFLSDDGHIII